MLRLWGALLFEAEIIVVINFKQILHTAVIFFIAAWIVGLSGCNLPVNPSHGISATDIHKEVETLTYGSIPTKALTPIIESWAILKDDFVNPNQIDIPAINNAAVTAIKSTVGAQIKYDPDIGTTIQDPPTSFPKELMPIWNAWALSFLKYNTPTNPIDVIKLEQTIIRSMLQELHDPYTSYISPGRFKIDSRDIKGDYEGIGAEIHKQGAKITLVPMPDGPAYAAGIRTGDSLIEVDGASVQGLTVIEIVNAVRGPKGSAVAMRIQPIIGNVPKTVTVIRDVIRIKSVSWNLTPEDFVYVKLYGFYDNTFAAMSNIVEESLHSGAKGMILDLRNNPGGLLTSVVDIASIFLEDDQIVTYQMDGKDNRLEWAPNDVSVAWTLPVVVLVNEFSASASEVLGGALQDHGRGQLIGSRTFGKGSVNRLKGLSDGGGLYYTYAHWFTPNGGLIEGKGLNPDHEVDKAINQNRDRHLEQALIILRELVEAEYAEEYTAANQSR